MATPSPSAARQLSSWRCVWSGYVGKQFLKGGHHLLLQNVTGHVGIHVSLNEPQLPVPAVVMQPQTMMLPPPCLTVGKAQFSWYSSPGRRHTCWKPSESNNFTLDQGSQTQLTWGLLEVESGSGWAALSIPQKKGFTYSKKKEHNLSNLLNLYY